MQAAIDRYFPLMLGSSARAIPPNNALYRRCGIKQRTNAEMRADFIERCKTLVEQELGLKLPPAPAEAA